MLFHLFRHQPSLINHYHSPLCTMNHHWPPSLILFSHQPLWINQLSTIYPPSVCWLLAFTHLLFSYLPPWTNQLRAIIGHEHLTMNHSPLLNYHHKPWAIHHLRHCAIISFSSSLVSALALGSVVKDTVPRSMACCGMPRDAAGTGDARCGNCCCFGYGDVRWLNKSWVVDD